MSSQHIVVPNQLDAYLVEETVEVHVYTVASGGVQKEVLTMAIPQAQDVARDGHDRSGAAVRQSGRVPTANTHLDIYLTTHSLDSG